MCVIWRKLISIKRQCTVLNWMQLVTVRNSRRHFDYFLENYNEKTGIESLVTFLKSVNYFDSKKLTILRFKSLVVKLFWNFHYLILALALNKKFCQQCLLWIQDWIIYVGWGLSHGNYFFLEKLIDHELIWKYTNKSGWC